MRKNIFSVFVFMVALFGGVLLWSSAYAAAPQITNVKYKAVGDSPKVAVFLDQGVQRFGGGDLTPADFTLGGASSTGATINNVWANDSDNIYVLTLNVNVNAPSTGLWTVAASSTVRNAANEVATTTAIDLNGKGDNTAPSVTGIFQYASVALTAMFSEEVNAQTATSSGSYANFLTSAGGDTPGIQNRFLVPELTFAILETTASTTLGWGAGNSIDVGSIQDLVGNPMSATSTQTILPALKVSEVKAAASSNTQDEFVELYNFGDFDLNISTSTLFMHLRNGAVNTVVPLILMKTQIPGKGYFLVGNQTSYSGSVSLDANYASSTDILTGNSGIYISASSTADQLVIDLLGMGSSAIKETATTTVLAAGKSYERKAQTASATSTMAVGGGDEFKGNSQDSNNNSQDFLLRDIPQPQNSMSQKEFPFGGPGQNDTGAPQVMGSFPSGMPGEMVPNNMGYVGFYFNEPVQDNTVTATTVKLFANSAPATNLCSSISYTNFPAPTDPPGKCVVSSTLAAETHTFKIFGDPANGTSSTAVRDVAGNALNQPGANNGVSGNYVITFTPSSGGSNYTFMAPPVFVMGSLPFPGAVNVPTNIQKVYVKFSGDVATSTLNVTNIRLLKVSDSSVVSLSSVTPSASESRFASDIAIMNLSGALSANTQYQVSVTGVTDTQSQPVGAPPMFTFTTGAGADASGPLVTGKLPSISSGVPVNAIDIHVMTDDKLDPSTIASTTVKVLQGSNEIPGIVDFDPFTGEIMFFANNVFQANTSYTVSVNATPTSPCVKNLSNICLQDNDGTADGAYKFSFTTGGADTTGPGVMFANADQRNLSVSFNEPVNKLEAETLDNFSLVVGGATTTLSSMAGQQVFYDAVGRTTVIENLNLPMGSSFTMTISNIHDLSGNLIGAQNTTQGTVQDMGKTGGFVGPGGPPPDFFAMPENFASSTFGFVPQVNVRPMSPLVGISTLYFIDLPLSRQVKSLAGGGKIVLTFPTGFDVSGAILDPYSPMNSDINGPGPGTVGISSLTINSGARAIDVNLSQNTRCDTGNAAPCSGDAYDFLHIDIKGIVNSSIPKDMSSSGYTVDVKTMDSSTVVESMTSQAFYLIPGGSGNLLVVLNAAGASTGTTTVRIFSPSTGPRDAVTTAFSGGYATSTFTGLVADYYGIFTDSLITLGAIDYIGQMMPMPAQVSGSGTTTVSLALQSTASLTTVTVNLTGPVGKTVDVFANSTNKFIKKKAVTTGSSQNVTLKLSDGTWWVGVGPAMPDDPFSGPPPAPDFVMQPPTQVIISGTAVKESSGTADDGTVVFTLSSADKAIVGTVTDASGKTIVNAEVFAYSPMGGFGTHGSTDGLGKFSMNVGVGMYQVGVFVPGLPPSGETAVEVKSDGTLVANGQTVSSLTLKLLKPDRTISGKVLDQSNNPVQGAGVFAYCDPLVSNNACFGPGDHTGAPTNSDGSYTLYVKNGTWKVGAFLPGYGELPQVQKVVSGSDATNVNFSPSTETTFRAISGAVCRDANSNSACDNGEGVSGVFVRAESSQGANQSVTDQSGNYSIRTASSTNYTISAFDPGLGQLPPISNVAATSSDATGKNFVIGALKTITVNVKNSSGAAVNIGELFLDFFDFSTQIGNHLEIRNATTSSINLPNGSYRVRASLKGASLADSAIASDSGSTATTTNATLIVDGNEAIKITVPSLGIVSGKVYKGSAASGNELGDAFVNFGDPSSGIFAGVQTNASGTYSLKLPLGSYNVLAQKPGYLANPASVSIATSTATTTLNLIVDQTSLAISGTVSVSGMAASKAFVRAEKLGGGFSGAQVDASGAYSLPVTAGTWRLFAMAEGYAEQEYSTPLEISGSSASGINFNLTTKVTLAAPKVCQITPAQGGTCDDATNGIRVIVPPSALGSGTTAATLTIKQNNARQQTSGSKPVGTGFDFSVTDSNGSTVSNFNSAVTLEFTQATTTLIADGINTKTKTDGVKIILWSEAMKDYDVLTTTVEYLNASSALVSSPAENLSNVAYIKFKALTTHFSGGGPGQGGDSLAPAAPGAPSVSGGSSSISVSWSAVATNSDGSAISDLSDYRVWRSTGGSYSVISTVSAPAVSYTDSSVTSGTTYYYKVTVRDTNSNESAQSSASSGVTLTVSSGGAIPSWIFNTANAATTATTTAQTTTPSPIVVSVTPSPTVAATLIRVEGDPRVYVIVNNVKRHIPNPEVFNSYGYKWSDIKLVGAAEAAKYSTTILMKLANNPKIYAIENSAKKWITSPVEFNAKGYKWDAILEVNAAELAVYPESALVVSGAVAGKINTELEFGMRSEQVRLLQEFLAKDKAIYPEGKITGYFGPATKAAVKRFQVKYGISQVGRVGPATMAKLSELMK